jgi:hypothetical protein
MDLNNHTEPAGTAFYVSSTLVLLPSTEEASAAQSMLILGDIRSASRLPSRVGGWKENNGRLLKAVDKHRVTGRHRFNKAVWR